MVSESSLSALAWLKRVAAVQVIAGDVDATLVRFLRARKGKVPDAFKMLKGAHARPAAVGWKVEVLSVVGRWLMWGRRGQTRCCGDGRTTSTWPWRRALALCPWQPSALG